ncbi:MAG TPA: TonB-dependent receptor plug domain-containing protein, partial [Kofleriaceae bacterium]|nr:TonB-dependent receptor plug domain-containing protein [Kofleriaceae bacterium]
MAPAHADEPGETIVIVDSTPRASEDEAASASVITSDRTPRSAETMSDLLGSVPGASVSRLGGVGAPALLSLRGSSWDQVSVYLDGVNLNIAAGGGVDVSALPVGDLARVEVYRGATPIAYGGSAIGGVLAVETRRPRRDGATLEAGAGSFGTWLGGGSMSLAGERYGLYVGAHTLKTAGTFDFIDDKGTAFDTSDDEIKARQNNRVHELDGVVRGGLALSGDRELSLLVLGFDREQGVSGFPRYPTMKSSLHTRRAIGSLAYRSRDELGASSLLRAQAYGYGLEQRLTDPLAEILST